MSSFLGQRLGARWKAALARAHCYEFCQERCGARLLFFFLCYCLCLFFLSDVGEISKRSPGLEQFLPLLILLSVLGPLGDGTS